MLTLFLMPKCKEKVFMKTQTISVIYFIYSLRNLFSLQNISRTSYALGFQFI